MKQPQIKVRISDKQKACPLNKTSIKQIVREVIRFEGQTCHEVILHFVTNEEMCRLHAEFFNDPSPTDCISFPIDDPDETHYRVLGEIFICPETAIEFVKNNGGDNKIEITLYIIHGLLHLMGYDDIKASDRKLMREMEKKHLDHLSDLNLYLVQNSKS